MNAINNQVSSVSGIAQLHERTKEAERLADLRQILLLERVCAEDELKSKLVQAQEELLAANTECEQLKEFAEEKAGENGEALELKNKVDILESNLSKREKQVEFMRVEAEKQRKDNSAKIAEMKKEIEQAEKARDRAVVAKSKYIAEVNDLSKQIAEAKVGIRAMANQVHDLSEYLAASVYMIEDLADSAKAENDTEKENVKVMRLFVKDVGAHKIAKERDIATIVKEQRAKFAK